ncbi:MAG: hypothetical protein PHY48_15450 [Candidatus Cloacimonetes bacterium]|nr:hypothetical protein [Candidatus Cloacimonadota bacterium]
MIKFYNIWVMTIIFSCFVEISFSETSPLLKYDDEDPTDLVASVAGYQQMQKHASGINVPVFSLEVDAKIGDVIGILFSIVAPTNYIGHIFWVECPTKYGCFENQSYPSDKLFPTNQLYSFSLSDSNILSMLESTSRMAPEDRMTTWHLPTHLYFYKLKDAIEYLENKKKKLEHDKSDLPDLKKKLAEERKKHLSGGRRSSRYKILAGKVGNTLHEITQIESDIRDVERRILRLRKFDDSESINEVGGN